MGMSAERGLDVLRQIDPTADLVAEGDGWCVHHAITSECDLPSPCGPDRDSLLQRIVLVLSMSPSVGANGHTWRWRKGWHQPGGQHWEQIT